MFHRQLAELGDLTAVDPDVEPVDKRTRDLGLPDGVWWGATVVFGLALMAAAIALLVPLGEQAADLGAGGVLTAALVFAAKRWGHRRFRLRVAARAAGKILLATAALVAGSLMWPRLLALWQAG